MIKKILNYTIILIMFFLFTNNVKAEEVYNRGAEFNWCDNYTDKCYITNVRYNSEAIVTLIGPYNAIDYNSGKFEYLSGIRFWSEIDGKENDVISLYYTLTLTGLQESETYTNDWLNNKNSYYSSSNVTILNASLISNTYQQDKSPTIIDEHPVYLGTQTIKFKVNVQLNQDFTSSSLYIGIGSYSTNNSLSSILVYQHIASVVTLFADNYYSLDNSSTIINQNDTIINQNQQTNEELGKLNDNITNSTEDLKDSITESNKETQDVIKDQFNSCRDSVNLIDSSLTNDNSLGINYVYNLDGSISYSGTATTNYSVIIPKTYVNLPSGTYTFSSKNTFDFKELYLFLYYEDGTRKEIALYPNYLSSTFTLEQEITSIYVFSGNLTSGNKYNGNLYIQLQKGSSATPFEIYGKICSNKIDETNDKLNQTNQQLGNLNNSLNDSDTSGATNEAGNFFSGFQTDTFGLTSIITAPLDLIGSITSSSCSPLGLQVPFVDNVTLNLPCMSTIYQKHFGSFLSVYQTITFGIVAYWVCVRIFALVKDFKNPDHDEIEVLDL